MPITHERKCECIEYSSTLIKVDKTFAKDLDTITKYGDRVTGFIMVEGDSSKIKYKSLLKSAILVESDDDLK